MELREDRKKDYELRHQKNIEEENSQRDGTIILMIDPAETILE